MKKKIVLLLLAAALCLPSTAYASTANDEAVVQEANTSQFYALYSDDIPAQNGDKFYIEFQDILGKSYNMVVDASTATESPLQINMEPGTYYVTNVAYVGYNSNIETQGFCITTTFSVGDEALNEIRIGIGTTKADQIYSEYRDTLYIKNNDIVSNTTAYEQEPTDESDGTVVEESTPVSDDVENKETGESTETTDTTENQENTTETSDEENTEESLVKEDEDKESKQKTAILVKKIFMQNIPVYFIVIALVIVIIKKKKQEDSMSD